MSLSKKSLRNLVRWRANERCEYCRLPEMFSGSIFHVDHIIPEKHGGRGSKGNLALSCPWCNFSKSCNLSGIDSITRKIVPLFHPRQMNWFEHFAFRGFRLSGLTPTGRATIRVLQLNSDDQLDIRRALFDAMLFRKVKVRSEWLRSRLAKLEQVQEKGRLSLVHKNRLINFAALELTDLLFDPYRTNQEILELLDRFDRTYSDGDLLR